ncbi:DMT family transporter [Sphingomonas xinjiangensis]|uniref:Drug/metabolite transporter (DMT)-like permease n=1 Tax=Sphingomonas xinjiangensis TaxID=643568 RepID=A0A840YEE6_9SPHN|nr:DMT family transporter [Sphingomonas xinjiangensis]MBB5711214.1 drug/metabolite transporter (DMT)-like permease [Sphingomonas xinjiangensis]
MDSQPAARNHAALALLAAVIANVALAFGPLFVRYADVGPVAAGFWRLALATPVLLVAAFAMGQRPISASKGLWGVLAIAGVAFAADLASWHIGIVRTTLANSTLFGNSATLIFPIYGFIAARAWPSRMQGLALLLAAIGGGLLLGRSASLSSTHLAGDLFCLLAGVLYAVYFIFMARARARLAPVPALALSSLATIPPLLILSLTLGEQVMPGNWWPLLALAIVSQLIGQGCMIYALGHLSPLVVGIALLIQPAVAAALGWVIFDEQLAAADAFGAILVAVALVLVRQSGSRQPQQLAPAAQEPKST